MDLGISGKRAFVLGGGSGIGRGIAQALSAEGVDVAIVSRNLSRLEQTAAEIQAKNSRVVALAGDLSDRATVLDAFNQATDMLGDIDILVNNSGGPPRKGVVDVTGEEWTSQFESMVLALMELTKLALPAMRKNKWGRIITVGSGGVIQPIPNLAISNTMRAALVGWSKSLANEVARDGVTVNLLLPSSTMTDRLREVWSVEAERTGRAIEEFENDFASILPTGRLGTIEEFGAVAAFIASQHSGYITGSMIRIDGGYITAI